AEVADGVGLARWIVCRKDRSRGQPAAAVAVRQPEREVIEAGRPRAERLARGVQEVVAVVVRDGGRRVVVPDAITVVIEPNLAAGQPGLAGFLNTASVQVVEHRAAKAGGHRAVFE